MPGRPQGIPDHDGTGEFGTGRYLDIQGWHTKDLDTYTAFSILVDRSICQAEQQASAGH